jgi:hypothetical protein
MAVPSSGTCAAPDSTHAATAPFDLQESTAARMRTMFVRRTGALDAFVLLVSQPSSAAAMNAARAPRRV